jgi:hypothetical protein
MEPLSLNAIYADEAAARCLEGHERDHRERVRRALGPNEPIHAYWWGDVGGLVLVTDQRLLQFPKLTRRRWWFGYDISFETWSHPYATLVGLRYEKGSFFELPRVLARKSDGTEVPILLGKADPQARAFFTETIERVLAAWHARHEGATVEMPLAEANPELAARLDALDDLRRAGALSDEDYERARAKLLEE